MSAAPAGSKKPTGTKRAGAPKKALGKAAVSAPPSSAPATTDQPVAARSRGGKVLSVASECAPLVKTGGLADVVGALPAALAPLGWQFRTLIPAYRGLLAKLENPVEMWSDPDLYGGPARVMAGQIAGLELLLLDAPHLFDRAGSLYLDETGSDWSDNPRRFAALSWAAAEIAKHGLSDGWVPDLLHCHDWQAGFAPLWARDIPSVMTIHNVAFQGIAPARAIEDLRLPAAEFRTEGYEYWGKVSALKAGLVYAGAISTVSPTYAAELTTPEFGFGLEGVIRARASVLSGILNGVDLSVWNPATDPLIAANYSAADMTGKAACAAALRDEFGLDAQGGPLFIVVSRLTRQKGLDLLLDALPGLVARGGQLAVLGTGEPDLQEGYLRAAARWTGRVAVHIGYDEALSHRMFAGGDVVLVPSRFEPSGLTQMYGLAYGTLPLVARTGGLADSVIDANVAALRDQVATGLQFAPVTADALNLALQKAASLYAQPEIWQRMTARAMAHPVGWDASARDYAALYDRLTGR
ncbi:glycogen synthase GlgA [Paracoccus aurantiacus]|uniref:Glycogen synthase n=1 Tax=Paracoccus aurantiacus TaxID=2599412 RepID=A0A5C6S919_9RHOB|nr:glycogen synthase GlgA [Paracoccus aurantiacus]TXB70946.1 glycogen synthase GlgA [Paracoccus aurantiacus]